MQERVQKQIPYDICKLTSTTLDLVGRANMALGATSETSYLLMGMAGPASREASACSLKSKATQCQHTTPV